MSTDNDSHDRLLREHTELLRENNKLLRKLWRSEVVGIWLRIFWYALLIGLPFALYFYVFEPYFAAFGSSYEQFRLGIRELPGFKGIELFFPTEE